MAAFPELSAGVAVSIFAGITDFFPIGDSSIGANTTESRTQIPIRTAGTFSNLYCTITSNGQTVATTVKTRKNTADGAQSVSIGASTSGDFQDTVNTDTIIAGDKFNYESITGAGGATAIVISAFGIVFSATTNSSKNYAQQGGIFSTASSTTFQVLAGSNGVNATETNTQFKLKTGGTLKNLAILVGTNGRTTATTVGTRIGGVNGNLVVSFGSGITGLLEDTTHTDTVSLGDLVNYYIKTSTGTGTFNCVFMSVELATTNSDQHLIAGNATGNTVNKAVTDYFAPAGDLGSVTTTEGNVDLEALTPFTASNLECHLSANTVTATSTLTLRKNAGNAANTLSIGSSTTGYFEDTTPHSDTILATDKIDYQLVTGSTGTSLTVNSIGILMNVAVASFTWQQLISAGQEVPREFYERTEVVDY